MRKVLTFLVSLWICFQAITAFAEPPASLTKTESVLVSMSGTVEVAPLNKDTWTAAKANQKLSPGERIRTGKKSRAAVRLPNDNVLRISAETTYSIPNLTRPTE